MNRLMMVAMIAGLLLSTNSCSVLKKKQLSKTKSTEKISNDIAVNTVRIDSSLLSVNTSRKDIQVSLDEKLSIKNANPINNIMIEAAFRIDTGATLAKDTVIKLVDINNNGVTLAVYQNPKTKELRAKVTTPKGESDTPFSQIDFTRKIESSDKSVDSLATFENHSELKSDSLDRSITDKSQKTVTDQKSKDTTASWPIWLGAVLVVSFFIWLGFKKK